MRRGVVGTKRAGSGLPRTGFSRSPAPDRLATLSHSLASYLAIDRLRALSRGAEVPGAEDGSALFADVCGFTARSDRLVRELAIVIGHPID